MMRREPITVCIIPLIVSYRYRKARFLHHVFCGELFLLLKSRDVLEDFL